MKQFEIGHEYFDTWACDSDSITVIKIVGRSAKMVTFERQGKTRRAKIYTDSRGEYIIPDRYSMAPVYRAERELLAKNLAVEAVPVQNWPEAVEASTHAAEITGYTVSPDLLAFGCLATLFGRLNRKQNDFLLAVVDGADAVR